MRLSKVELRERSRELRELVNRWDPIGVMDDPEWPRDEYECLVGPVLRRLEEDAPVSEIATFLQGELTDHFGLSTPDQDVENWAREARQWYETRWAGVGKHAARGRRLSDGRQVSNVRCSRRAPVGPPEERLASGIAEAQYSSVDGDALAAELGRSAALPRLQQQLHAFYDAPPFPPVRCLHRAQPAPTHTSGGASTGVYPLRG
jgi:hypothetical protein